MWRFFHREVGWLVGAGVHGGVSPPSPPTSLRRLLKSAIVYVVVGIFYVEPAWSRRSPSVTPHAVAVGIRAVSLMEDSVEMTRNGVGCLLREASTIWLLALGLGSNLS